MPTTGRAAPRPNVLLLVLDALRADAVEAYGAPAGSSPVLLGLARRGVAVPDVRSTASWTLPSHIAMFSGQLGRGLGLGQAPDRSVQGAAPVVRAQRERLLAEVLAGAGYTTRGVTTNVWAGPRAGFDAGFEELTELDTSRHNALGGGLWQRLKWDLEAVRARADDGATEVERVLGSWISGLDGSPFFWFANVVECHSPYLPPRPYAGLPPLARIQAARDAERHLTFSGILRACLGVDTVAPAALARMRRLYAASLRYVDAWVGRVLERLERAGALERTLVVVCADHGENLGEGGRLGHALSVDERLLRVPMIVAGPGSDRFRGMRSLVELPARIADAVGLEDHPWSRELPAGLPIAQWDPFDVGEERLAEVRRDWGLDEAAERELMSPRTCAVDGDLKLVRRGGPDDEALYDLRTDPLEESPLRDEGSMAARAGAVLDSLRAALDHPAAQRIGEVTAAPDELPESEVADIERRMRLMGYL